MANDDTRFDVWHRLASEAMLKAAKGDFSVKGAEVADLLDNAERCGGHAREFATEKPLELLAEGLLKTVDSLRGYYNVTSHGND